MMKKRLGYLHHLLTLEEESLVKVVFQKLKNTNTKSWINIVSEDLKELEINLTFDEITRMSKEKFKTVVKSACEKACFAELVEEKKKLKKGKENTYSELKIQPYLSQGRGFSIDEKRKIYHIRNREVYLKSNFPSAHKDTNCSAPHIYPTIADQKHVYSCSFLNEESAVSKDVKYEDIFGRDSLKQFEVMKIFYHRYEMFKKHYPSQRDVLGGHIDPRRAFLGSKKRKVDISRKKK